MTDLRTGHPVQQLFRPVVRWITGPKPHRHQTKVLRRLSDEWAKRTLSTRFVIVSTFVIFTTMLHLGAWMDGRIRKSSIQAAATAAARYMEHALHGDLQFIATERTLPESAQLAIQRVMADTALGRSILEVKIWRTDGTLLYSARGSRSEENLPPTAHLLGALRGQVTAHFDEEKSIAPTSDRAVGPPVFEVYVPIREKTTGRTIGVSEFYEDATTIVQEFTIARQQSWIVIGSLTLGMLALLFGIVHRGSLLILEQKRSLEARLSEKSRLLQQNQRLQSRLIQAQHQTHDLSDRLLRRIGADLHDGPAQLLSLALLRLHELSPTDAQAVMTNLDNEDPLATVRNATRDALSEIRCISAGLSLPELVHLTLADTVRLAITNHERRTKTAVVTEIGDVPMATHIMVRTCIYRCIQECLSNTFRHAGGKGQRVHVSSDPLNISLSVADQGPGFSQNDIAHKDIEQRDGTLGLVGLRHRVESLGGKVEVNSRLNYGTTVTIRLPQTGHYDKEI